MKCPNCGEPLKTRRTVQEDDCTYRERNCEHCNEWYPSEEKLMPKECDKTLNATYSMKLLQIPAKSPL